MDLETFRYLLTADGQRLLAEVAASYDGSTDGALSVSTRLGKTHPADQVAAAMTQTRLRHKAVTKFGSDAAALYFTTDTLEQATHRRLADHRAERAAASGATSVLDLGCGLGADLIAFSRAGLAVRGVEQDPLTALVAQANLAALSLTGEVVVGDATQVELDADLVYVDPARRGPAGRVFNPALASPPWSFVQSLLAAEAVVKLAPGIPHSLVPPTVEAEWVSLDGQLREAVLWSGRAARDERRATVMASTRETLTITAADDPGEAAVRAVGSYVYEPDDAVIRAHLVTAVAAACDGWLLDPHLAYVSSDTLTLDTPSRAYRVIDVLPFKEKALRAELRARGIGALTIKKRGVSITPEVLRQRLRLNGPESATIIITRTPESASVLLVAPL